MLLERNGSPVEIDVEMAPLIQALWGAGVSTEYCCQGDPDDGTKAGIDRLVNGGGYHPGYLTFSTIKDASRFVELCGGIEPLLPKLKRLHVGDGFYLDGKVSIYFHNSKLVGITELVLRSLTRP